MATLIPLELPPVANVRHLSTSVLSRGQNLGGKDRRLRRPKKDFFDFPVLTFGGETFEIPKFGGDIPPLPPLQRGKKEHWSRVILGKYRYEKIPKRVSVFSRPGIDLLLIFLETRHPYFSFKIYLKKIG